MVRDPQRERTPPRVIGVVPARYDSRRWPGKALASVNGRPLAAWGWMSLQTTPGVEQVYVATDDDRIAEWARSVGAEVAMTSSTCRNGTERVAEVAEDYKADIYINVQADQTGLEPGAISKLIAYMVAHPGTPMATLGRSLHSIHELDSSDNVFVRADESGIAMSFRRGGDSIPADDWQRHIGVYGYRANALAQYVSTPPSADEVVHSLEQLRAFDLHWEIGLVQVQSNVMSHDRPPDPGRGSKSESRNIISNANRISTYA
jgi:3-deoxy-manno-octulosonate cytidylyltransferase (CMP-KDO synthetase)